MEAQAIKRVAEQEEIARFRIVERLDAELVTPAEEKLLPGIPDSEGKIAAQMLDTFFTPGGIRVQDQIGIRSGMPYTASFLFEFSFQFGAAVEPRISGNPVLPVETCGLALVERFVRGAQHRVAKSEGAGRPGLAGVGTTVVKGMRKSAEEFPLHRSAFPFDDRRCQRCRLNAFVPPCGRCRALEWAEMNMRIFGVVQCDTVQFDPRVRFKTLLLFARADT